MREIKFRAWNTDYRKPIMESFTLKEEIKLKYLHDKNIMQFTGLKDKNGKEIYEGDVINFFHSEGKQYSKKNATVEYVQAWCGFYFAENIRLNSCQRIEVIGNIYENPELITAEPEEEKFSKGNVVKHKDAAYSEEFTIVRIEDEGHILIQGPESKYKAPFYTDIEKLIKVN